MEITIRDAPPEERRSQPVTFQPKSGDHAIVEVVLGIQFARNFSAPELEGLAAAHDRWKERLPRLGRTAILQLHIGDKPPPNASQLLPSTGGVTFDRVKPDGNLEWRLRADEGSIYVNCLNYEGWDAVWPQARDYLREASEVVAHPENEVRGLVLQYVDVFEWVEEPDLYRVDALLDRESPFIPASLWEKEQLWHLHQGWYRSDNLPASGRLLERIHLDAVIDDEGKPTVRMDTFLSLELNPLVNWKSLFVDDQPEAERIFNDLHDLAKDLVRAHINEEMAERIGLDA